VIGQLDCERHRENPSAEVKNVMNQKIDRSGWRAALDSLSKSLGGKQAEIEIAALSVGDQIAAEWVPIIGIAYDPKDDIVEVALEGLDHIISRPRELHFQQQGGLVSALEIVDADGVRNIVKFREPLMLPAP
jgi:hypothetical protein